MPFQPAPNIAQVQIVGSVDGCVTINNLFFEISGGGITDVNLLGLALTVSNWAGSQLAPSLSEDWSLQRVIATDLTTATGPRVEVPNILPGGVAGEAAPNNVAACVSFRTAARGRSYRGRNYVPGIPNSVITLNAMGPTFIADLTSAYSQMIGPGVFLPGWEWGVLSRYEAGVPRAAGILTPIITATVTSGYVRSMRSRSVGHGA